MVELPYPWPRMPRGARCDHLFPHMTRCPKPAVETVWSVPTHPDGKGHAAYLCAEHTRFRVEHGHAVRNPRRRPSRELSR